MIGCNAKLAIANREAIHSAPGWSWEILPEPTNCYSGTGDSSGLSRYLVAYSGVRF
jgi:hypothetical protein